MKDSDNNQITLKVAETNSRLVGRGMALIDPEVMKDLDLSTGDVIEVSGEKKGYVILWSSPTADHGKKLIRIDGYTRSEIGVGIDDSVTIRKVIVKKAEQVILAPTEELSIVGLEEYLPELLEGRVVAKGEVIPLNVMGRRIGFTVTSVSPSDATVSLIDSNTEFVIGTVPKKSDKGVPRVTYEDIGGLRNEVQKVREMIELPLRHPEIFERIGIEAPKGVLLHGPPGTGKTLLAKAVANETNANFYSIGGPEIMSKFYGESEEKLREIFKEAQEKAPSIIFIDEIDSIAPKREEVSGDMEKRIVSQLLTLMDGISSRGKLVVIGATNRPNAIDPALRRPGRFDRILEVPPPDKDARKQIFQIHTKKKPLDSDVNIDKLVERTDGMTGAEIAAIVNAAAMTAIKEHVNRKGTKLKISMKHFENAFNKIRTKSSGNIVK